MRNLLNRGNDLKAGRFDPSDNRSFDADDRGIRSSAASTFRDSRGRCEDGAAVEAQSSIQSRHPVADVLIEAFAQGFAGLMASGTGRLARQLGNTKDGRDAHPTLHHPNRKSADKF
jgi:hypothetical protein